MARHSNEPSLIGWLLGLQFRAYATLRQLFIIICTSQTLTLFNVYGRFFNAHFSASICMFAAQARLASKPIHKETYTNTSKRPSPHRNSHRTPSLHPLNDSSVTLPPLPVWSRSLGRTPRALLTPSRSPAQGRCERRRMDLHHTSRWLGARFHRCCGWYCGHMGRDDGKEEYDAVGYIALHGSRWMQCCDPDLYGAQNTSLIDVHSGTLCRVLRLHQYNGAPRTSEHTKDTIHEQDSSQAP